MIVLLSEVLGSNRIIQLHCSAFGHQAFHNFAGRGFADIVGVRLKGQSPDADDCAAQVAKGFMQFRDDHEALVFVHLNHRFQQLELVVDVTGDLNQRIGVFRETGASITDTGLQERGADSPVHSHAFRHHGYISSHFFANVGNLINKRNFGCQECV
ncbi:hypothetical protein D3C87_1599910 [compost metagenome]